MNASRLSYVAYLVLVLAVTYSLYLGSEATQLARQVDYRGDIRACTQENLIRKEANQRNGQLEKTARLVVKAFLVSSKADRLRGDNTNRKLRKIAREADRIRTKFKLVPTTNCKKEIPAP